jgi:predicted nucleic acid binding AN1-type Zn finger protein
VTGTLPESGNYILTVFPGDGRQTSFELSVLIR